MKPRRVANQANRVSGFVLVVIAVVLFLVGDPWSLNTQRNLPVGEALNNAEAALSTLVLALVAAGGVAFAIASVSWGERTVTVVNPLCAWEFPRAEVSSVSASGPWPVVRLRSGRRIILFALERSPAAISRDAPTSIPPDLARAEWGEGDSESMGTRRHWWPAVLSATPLLLGLVACGAGVKFGGTVHAWWPIFA